MRAGWLVIAAAFLAVLAGTLSSSACYAQQRFALLIGNQAYAIAGLVLNGRFALPVEAVAGIDRRTHVSTLA
jgi:hypothetical protein